jgi:hypothetical protein
MPEEAAALAFAVWTGFAPVPAPVLAAVQGAFPDTGAVLASAPVPREALPLAWLPPLLLPLSLQPGAARPRTTARGRVFKVFEVFLEVITGAAPEIGTLAPTVGVDRR